MEIATVAKAVLEERGFELKFLTHRPVDRKGHVVHLFRGKTVHGDKTVRFAATFKDGQLGELVQVGSSARKRVSVCGRIRPKEVVLAQIQEHMKQYTAMVRSGSEQQWIEVALVYAEVLPSEGKLRAETPNKNVRDLANLLRRNRPQAFQQDGVHLLGKVREVSAYVVDGRITRSHVNKHSCGGDVVDRRRNPRSPFEPFCVSCKTSAA